MLGIVRETAFVFHKKFECLFLFLDAKKGTILSANY